MNNYKDRDNPVKKTTYDKLMRAWENSMELTRDFEVYSKEIENDTRLANIFGQFAEDEGRHASKFHEILREYQNNLQ
jgi:rubrerythrin